MNICRDTEYLGPTERGHVGVFECRTHLNGGADVSGVWVWTPSSLRVRSGATEKIFDFVLRYVELFVFSEA